ncbi:MAG: DUF2325 domain-containing protein [Oscillospiraceae bacterium]|nr:DUF2325 domain-containing protein [Oscillospiraceae bacterium]
MSVVIVGGNDCMTRQYKDICESFRCRAKVFTQMHDGLKNKIGSPDLLVLFTGTASHKMIKLALHSTGANTHVVRSHSSSASALKSILQEHAG